MRQHPQLSDFQPIVDLVDINDAGDISFNGEIQKTYETPNVSRDFILLQHLSNMLYAHYYAGIPVGTSFLSDGDSSGGTPTEAFMEQLQKANCSREKFDRGWIVEEVEPGGSVLVRKAGAKRYTYAGDFIREQHNAGPIQQGEKVKLLNRKEFFDGENSGFYHVFGETLLDFNNDAIVRLYFHTDPQGATQLVRLFTEQLNTWQIPFQFKCLKDDTAYRRFDSAVLYIEKRYFSIVMEIVEAALPALLPALKEGVPAFSRALAKGIGFAENPLNPVESFGTSRCKLIAKAIIDAWKQQLPKALWAGFIVTGIEQHFFRPDAFYLNPGSQYPYRFSPSFNN